MQVIRDGLIQGAGQRAQDASQNLLTTGAEMAISAGIGAGLTQAMLAGGKLRLGAEIAAVGLGLLTGADLYTRGKGVYDVYTNTLPNDIGNYLRQDAISRYAGSGVFDYSLMFASAGLGVAAGGGFRSFKALDSTTDTQVASEAPRNSSSTIADNAKDNREEQFRPKAMDIDKVVDDLEFALDYQISETAMSKISQALQQANHQEFNDILRKLEAKDVKFQGMDLGLGTWDEGSQRWDAVKMYNTDLNVVTHMIVQNGDSVPSIAEVETRVNPKRTDDDIKFYEKGLMLKNHLTEQSTLAPGQILVLPYPPG